MLRALGLGVERRNLRQPTIGVYGDGNGSCAAFHCNTSLFAWPQKDAPLDYAIFRAQQKGNQPAARAAIGGVEFRCIFNGAAFGILVQPHARSRNFEDGQLSAIKDLIGGGSQGIGICICLIGLLNLLLESSRLSQKFGASA